MRRLTAAEMDKVHGGMALRQAVNSGLHPDVGGEPGGPPSPVRGVPGDDDYWYVTPAIGPNQLSYGLSVNGGFGTFSANPKSSSYVVQNALNDVTLGLSMSSTGVTTGTVSLPNVGGSDFTLKGSIASNGQQTGDVQFSENGLTTTIGGGASAWNAGIGFTDGPYSGTASYNSSTGYSISFTGADIANLFGTPISCTFDVFGLGGSDAGAGLECWAGGKPPVQPEVASKSTASHYYSPAQTGHGVAIA